LLAVIDAILEADRTGPLKQRHTVKRILSGCATSTGSTVATQAVGVIGGVRCKLHFFCMDLPQSDAPLRFMKSYPAETTKAFLDGTSRPSRWRRSVATANGSGPGRSPNWRAITCFGIALAAPARGMTRARLRAW
jgi:hypothetical protein